VSSFNWPVSESLPLGGKLSVLSSCLSIKDHNLEFFTRYNNRYPFSIVTEGCFAIWREFSHVFVSNHSRNTGFFQPNLKVTIPDHSGRQCPIGGERCTRPYRRAPSMTDRVKYEESQCKD
jgi:hypothetical protein